MSESIETTRKSIAISQKTKDNIDKLISDYEIVSEAELYRQFIEIGYAFKKKQLDGDMGNGHEFLHIDASKQAAYHTIILENMAKNVANISQSELDKWKNIVTNTGHNVLASATEFYKIDKKRIKEIRESQD